jgi:hypothetical protein
VRRGGGRRLILGEFDVAAGDLTPPLRCRHTLNNITILSVDTRCVAAYAFLTVTTVGGPRAATLVGLRPLLGPTAQMHGGLLALRESNVHRRRRQRLRRN